MLFRSTIGRHSIIGAGALVTENFVVPEGSLVLGIPGVVVRKLRSDEVARILENARAYVGYAEAYRTGRVGSPGEERG